MKLSLLKGPPEGFGLVIGAAAAAVVVYLFRTWWSLRHIPGPFLASITNLQRVWWVKTKKAYLHHQAVHAKYGDIVRTGPNMVSIANPEAIPTVYPIRPGFTKGDFYLALRPYSEERGTVPLVFNIQDEAAHKQAKTPIAPFYSLTNVMAFEGLVDEVLALFSKQLDQRFVATGEVFDLGKWIQYFAFDAMGTMSFSRRYGFLEHGEDPHGVLDAIWAFFTAAAPMTQIPWLHQLLRNSRFMHMFRNKGGNWLLDYVTKTISERLRHVETGKHSSSEDFLARFLEAHRANEGLPAWCPYSWTFTNVVAGSDSVASLMRTIIHNLLAHPATLRRLREELATADISNQYPKWSEVRDLPYLDACVQEAGRIHPPFAMPFERVVPAGGTTVLGHYLPEGTVVGGSAYVVGRHKPTFGHDAESWSPERWLCPAAEKKRLEQSLLTFGGGRRVCLGKHIGILEIKKLIPFLLLNYEFEIINPAPLEIEHQFFLKQGGLECRIQKRDHPQCKSE
ncbi:putative cytochrome P450 oxidoreductase [Aspergillus steynii IBT 23096]|uniref:Putative cytochrome P450 oxidoreductase n=1 Tax=Aspergillus steynii IBT 23096 TaxID=1392250 RepID=A0A2I2G927_9EURO|nr:putative cytochrome P450 oxidoreductase [Aspergillus steynii IBT 23096]PLB49343.1 putative cytochrome P450 oxidoreductase [Aspergillus steynii IBT 23096]